ncbi:MAG TPA: ribose-phosphate pyrophosphokinase [Candidatus Nanoarchaeia archaeon]|nr:ribose-phosphate pyrophosphokinase [Candidatus Nanoarchaeia archaeon]
MSQAPLKLISGTANPVLAKEVADYLKMPLTPIEIKKFSDGEIYVRILESVRGSDVYVIQPTNSDVNDNLMELLIISDALKRSSPVSITAIIPYYGYARQDKKTKAREAITAKLVANMLQVAGIDRIIFFELHVPQVQGFFDIPSDNLDLLPLFAQFILEKKEKDFIVVSPDAGGAARARALAQILSVPIAIVDKRRQQHNQAKVENVIGDVRAKVCFLIDDMIDTAGSITEAAKILRKNGAVKVYAMATHGVLSGDAISRIDNSPIEELLISNTIAISPQKRLKKIKVLSIAKILAEDIRRTHEGSSMGTFYDDLYKSLAKTPAKKKK